MSDADVRTGKVRRATIARLVVAVAVVAAVAAVGQPPAGATMGDISRFAGTYAFGSGGDGGPATSAQLNGPTGVDVAADGRVFIADRANGRIRVVATDGTITTLASGLSSPVDVAVSDADGVVYVAEEGAFIDRISSIDITGGPTTPTIIAGGGASGYVGDGGPASAARFNSLGGIDVAPDGDVVIADRGNNRIRRIDVDTMTISLVAGSGVAGGDDGPVLSAQFAGPKDVAVASDGTIYVADELTNNVRRIAGGQVTRFAGSFDPGSTGDGGAATDARLSSPDGVAVGPDGAVYVADTGSNRVRRVDPDTGTITTVAGNGACCAAGDGGPATAASVGTPTRLAVDAAGGIYIAAELEHAIRYVEGASVPGPPLNVVAVADGPDVVLEWDPPADDGGAAVHTYLVYRDGALVATLTGGTFAETFTDVGVPEGAHVYTVSAVNPAGEGPPSSPATVVVAAQATTTSTTSPPPQPPPSAEPVPAQPTFVG